MRKSKQSIVTFKADETLVDALAGIENRSAFIRNAILAALENACPLCLGSGILSPMQRAHWEDFCRDHTVEECDECHERRLTCAAGEADSAPRTSH
ncbi:MAG: hypothetical protein JSV78_06970 [Phycisphaerales bacterium]|nr:MAG: hypothetical protein JSV78_06970 [Phycisphaerales bacterium]